MENPFASLLVLVVSVFVACDGNDDQKCRPIKALSGYASGPDDDGVTYDTEHIFFYDGGGLIKKEKYALDPKELQQTNEYFYSDGQLIREFITFPLSIPRMQHHHYYEYSPTSITTTTYVLVGTDTTEAYDQKLFRIEDPDDKVYHDIFSTQSYKFQDGNLIELGSYEVIEGDTLDHFLERYSFDTKESYTKTLAYKSTIPNEFPWATLSSQNNLVHAEYISGGWQKQYQFKFNSGKLIRYKNLNTGLTIDFEYQCN